jgi:hypothetical protein
MKRLRRISQLAILAALAVIAFAFTVGVRIPGGIRQKRAVAAVEAKGGGVLYRDVGDIFGWKTKLLAHDGIFGQCFSDVDQIDFHPRSSGAPIDDAGLEQLSPCLRDLKGLRVVDLYGTRITNRGLKQLIGLKEIEVLNLAGTGIDDSGLVCLSSFPKLDVLYLSHARITDAGLAGIVDTVFPELEKVYLDGTLVTADGVQKLSQRFVGLKVYWDGKLFRDGKAQAFPAEK